MRVLFFAMALFVGALLAWILTGPHRTVVHERVGPTVVERPIVSSPLTPLQAKRAKRTSAARSPDSRTTRGVVSTGALTTATKPGLAAPQKRRTQSRSPAKKRKTTTSPSKPTSAPQQSTTPTQTQPSQPAVTVPLPSACLPPIKFGTCP